MNNHARFIVQKDAFCSGTCTEGTCTWKTKCTWTCNNHDQKNATCGVAFGGDDCQFDVKINQCPAKIKLKVKVRVECFCDGVPVGGDGGVCEKEIEQTFDIHCCRCLQPQVDGDLTGSGTATKTTWKPPTVKPRCGTCTANNRPCKPENVTCSWSVFALEGEASIDGRADDCGGISVSHSEGAEYLIQLFVSWECVGCDHRTFCSKHFAWTVKGTKAKLEPDDD